MMQFKKGDKVVVRGLSMAFIVRDPYRDNEISLLIEGEFEDKTHRVLSARPSVLLPNDSETFAAEGWGNPFHPDPNPKLETIPVNVFATEKNAHGKLFDPIGQFHLVIEIFGSLDDLTTKVLKRLRSGTVLSYKTAPEAVAAQAEFLLYAGKVAAHGDLAVYGLTSVVDTKTGECINSACVSSTTQ